MYEAAISVSLPPGPLRGAVGEQTAAENTSLPRVVQALPLTPSRPRPRLLLIDMEKGK